MTAKEFWPKWTKVQSRPAKVPWETMLEFAEAYHAHESPNLALLMKLGSIVVHAEELMSPGGHTFDLEAMRPLLADPEVQEWIKSMGVYLPVKR